MVCIVEGLAEELELRVREALREDRDGEKKLNEEESAFEVDVTSDAEVVER